MASENPRLGFIGMGGMGSRMAARLLAAGYDLTTYNRHRERARVLEKQGAKIAAQPGELAAHADIVLSSLADDVAVENVMLGPGGALAAARPGTVFIGMSTVSPSLSRRLHDFAHEKGIFVLDAPVSGTTTVAEKGELVIFVGGDKAAYERCLPVLKVLGRVAHYMGPAGSGAAMKLCANTLLGAGNAGARRGGGLRSEGRSRARASSRSSRCHGGGFAEPEIQAGQRAQRSVPACFPFAADAQGLQFDPRHGDGLARRDARDRRRGTSQRGRARAAVGSGSRRGLFLGGESHGAESYSRSASQCFDFTS